jgi:hypothetical protein
LLRMSITLKMPKTLVNASIEINNNIDSSHKDLSCDKYDYCCSA